MAALGGEGEMMEVCFTTFLFSLYLLIFPAQRQLKSVISELVKSEIKRIGT